MNQGKRFSLVYLNRDKPVRDSKRFRNRLAAYYWENLHAYKNDIQKAIELEIGAELPYIANYGCSLSSFFKENEIRDILDTITIVYQTMNCILPIMAKNWKNFVSRCLQEENVGYQLDSECGVHYFVDEEFERNRFSTLSVLNTPDLVGVKAAYEDAYRHMDTVPPDTKAAVRSIFESLEIITKQLVDSRNLNKWVLENTLKEKALEVIGNDETTAKVVTEIFDGFGKWVNGMHNYRHGQPDEVPVAPSEEVTIYILSSGSSFLRLLVNIKNKNSNQTLNGDNGNSPTAG